MRQLILGFVLFLFVPAISGAEEAMQLPVDVSPLVLHTDKGEAQFDVEIARTEEERQRGLMYRSDFPAGRAMIFRFPQEKVVAMWMVNTPLPLDMVFINEAGQVVSVFENATPFSRAIISSHYPVSFVMELNAGQISQHGIAVGQTVTHPVICGKCGG